MFRDAINEIRLHPGRFVATLLAIAISVGFMAAIVIGVRTEENAVFNSNSLAVSKADVVVTGYSSSTEEVLEAIRQVPEVTAVDPVYSTGLPITHGQNSAFFTLYALPSEPFRWAELTQGKWASGLNEITLSSDSAERLGVGVGDTVQVGFDEESSEITIVGLTRDAPSLYTGTAYMSIPANNASAGSYVVKTTAETAVSSIAEALKSVDGGNWKVTTADDYRRETFNEMTGEFDIFRNLLLAFSAIALFVGMIIIANTFTILVTQRRRQIGLLRAVGASTGQVSSRLLTESVLLGLIGSLLGVVLGALVAAIAGLFTKSLFWGLQVPWADLVMIICVGVLATVISVIGPSFKATRVSPLEALQVVPPEAKAKRIGVVRTIICGILVVASAALLSQVWQQPKYGLVWAILGGGLFSVTALIAAPLYIPSLLRLGGRIFGFAGPTVRLAASNAARNPRRASATAVALMLAVGLIVTLQVAVSTVRTTAMAAIDQQYPVDVEVQAQTGELSQSLAQRLRDSGGAKVVVQVPSKEVNTENTRMVIRDVNPARQELGLSDKGNVADGEIHVSTFLAEDLPSEVTIAGAGTLKVVSQETLGWEQAAVSHDTYTKITGNEQVTEIWVKLTDRTSLTVLNQVTSVLKQENEIEVGGGAVIAGILTQVVNMILFVLTALLGVAVVIALVGVGNTLGLSVLERQRESALLRALGMQRRSLRGMLLAEAMMLSIVGVGVGILLGAAMGWLGVVSSVGMIPEEQRPEVVFSVDVFYTSGLILVCLLAAALSSVLPGRRAANATPTEALAVE